MGIRERRQERGAACCHKRVGTVRPLGETSGRSLGLPLRQPGLGRRGEGNVPNSGGNSSPLSSWAQGQGELREQLPRLRLPLCFRLPSPRRPSTYTYFHFRGHQRRDGKEKKKLLAKVRASLAKRGVKSDQAILGKH